MVQSLKAVVPLLAKHMGIAPNALYERQRALIRAGLLNKPQGRGPGSGVQADPISVATLLVAALSTDSLAETQKRTRELGRARPVDRDQECPLTHRSSFLDALAQVFTIDRLAKAVTRISVDRTNSHGQIEYLEHGIPRASEFVTSQKPISAKLRVVASIDEPTLKKIASDLADIFATGQNSAP